MHSVLHTVLRAKAILKSATVNSTVAAYAASFPGRWVRRVKLCQWSMRATPRADRNGNSAFEMVTGMRPQGPLSRVFDKVNDEYFHGYMMTPNLVWGQHSLSLLGHYSFGTDTITISKALREDADMLEYVMYHEMLHKKHKFDETPGGITRTHTKACREDEKKFRIKDFEKRLTAFVRKKKRERGPRKRRKSLLQAILDEFRQ